MTNQHCCIVVGVGLIGQKIVDILTLHFGQPLVPTTPIVWDKPQTIITVIDYIVRTVKPRKLDIIWSAGKAGFAATDNEMQCEFDVYSQVIRSLQVYDIALSINLLSSAGGIYENSTFVRSLDAVSPQRPYAYWKLKQEALLSELSIDARIYRIASVYGYKQGAGRLGLINTMIRRTLNRESILVFGSQNTLRDYIYHFDIARYIVANLTQNIFKIEILASGKATSICALINMVERLIRRRVKVLYVDGIDNSNDIVFDRHLIPKNLQLTSLEEGVLNVFTRMKSA